MNQPLSNFRLKEISLRERPYRDAYIIALFLVANIDKQRILKANIQGADIETIVMSKHTIKEVIHQYFSLYEGKIEETMRANMALALRNILLDDLWPNYSNYKRQALQYYLEKQQIFTPCHNIIANQNSYLEDNQVEVKASSEKESRKRSVSFP